MNGHKQSSNIHKQSGCSPTVITAEKHFPTPVKYIMIGNVTWLFELFPTRDNATQTNKT